MSLDLALASAQLSLNPAQFLGIPVALLGAVFLSFGAQLQHSGVKKVEARSTRKVTGGLDLGQFGALFSRPSWVFGTLMLGGAIVLQLVALSLSPLIVVQPLGAVALVITAILNSRVSHSKLNRASVVAIVMCVSGVALFVLIAAFTAVDTPVSDQQLETVAAIMGIVLVVFVVAFVLFRKRMKATAYIVGAGVLYGFVATLAKVVISRLQQGDFNWLTLTCLLGMIVGSAAGAYLIQTAYTLGPPDLVIAGLTVIDPIVAVGIGIVVLNEASQAPTIALVGFALTGILAILGVFGLARYHPQSEH
ncbi:MAG: multidrug transporter permease [Subtercola sp.]|nr:multidrug transporter permease [Subtercola sp.]